MQKRIKRCTSKYMIGIQVVVRGCGLFQVWSDWGHRQHASTWQVTITYEGAGSMLLEGEQTSIERHDMIWYIVGYTQPLVLSLVSAMARPFLQVLVFLVRLSDSSNSASPWSTRFSSL